MWQGAGTCLDIAEGAAVLLCDPQAVLGIIQIVAEGVRRVGLGQKGGEILRRIEVGEGLHEGLAPDLGQDGRILRARSSDLDAHLTPRSCSGEADV